MEQIVRSAVRNGERLPYIKRRVLDGVIQSALIRSRGSMTKAAAELGISRHTIRQRLPLCGKPIQTELSYREAWHELSRIAFNEAISMTGGKKRAAMRLLGSTSSTLWRYGK